MPKTFKTVSAAWKKKEVIIRSVQNIPACLKDTPEPDPLLKNNK